MRYFSAFLAILVLGCTQENAPNTLEGATEIANKVAEDWQPASFCWGCTALVPNWDGTISEDSGGRWQFFYTTKYSRNSFSFFVFADGSVGDVYESTFFDMGLPANFEAIKIPTLTNDHFAKLLSEAKRYFSDESQLTSVGIHSGGGLEAVLVTTDCEAAYFDVDTFEVLE